MLIPCDPENQLNTNEIKNSIKPGKKRCYCLSFMASHIWWVITPLKPAWSCPVSGLQCILALAR